MEEHLNPRWFVSSFTKEPSFYSGLAEMKVGDVRLGIVNAANPKELESLEEALLNPRFEASY
jgi:hypothetical protein